MGPGVPSADGCRLPHQVCGADGQRGAGRGAAGAPGGPPHPPRLPGARVQHAGLRAAGGQGGGDCARRRRQAAARLLPVGCAYLLGRAGRQGAAWLLQAAAITTLVSLQSVLFVDACLSAHLAGPSLLPPCRPPPRPQCPTCRWMWAAWGPTGSWPPPTRCAAPPALASSGAGARGSAAQRRAGRGGCRRARQAAPGRHSAAALGCSDAAGKQGQGC